jgi:undecaprenyl-diphosphatase
MEDILLKVFLAIVQGVTEWIPVSSSGHLFLIQQIFGVDYGLYFDISLHLGTLLAVFVYFGKDLIAMLEDVLRLRTNTDNFKLAILVLIASIPAGFVGFFFFDLFSTAFRNLLILAFGFAITSMVLFIASFDLKKRKEKVNFKDSILIGFAQVLALFPGISRSGMTISSLFLLGIKEKNALKFSFLMSIPVILGANIVSLGNESLSTELIFVTFISFISGLITIHLLYNFVLTSKKNLRWFGLYALLLSIFIFLYYFF